jgi:hypothetical protein
MKLTTIDEILPVNQTIKRINSMEGSEKQIKLTSSIILNPIKIVYIAKTRTNTTI